MAQGKADGGRPRSIWSEALRAAYLALLRETGNGRASARRLGHPTLFDNRKKRDPVFRRECREAVAEADFRLRQASGAFPEAGLPRIEFKSMPSGDEPGETREQVIRRTSNGLLQITYVRDGQIGSKDEEAFLALFRATGQFEASARAIGFGESAFYRHMAKWPDFARRCEQARDEAQVMLHYQLADHAHALMRRPGEARLEGAPEVPFDPAAAMRILHFLDRRKAGRLGGRPRKRPPERTFEEAVESILAKVEAVERHRKLMEEKARRQEDSSPPLQGEGS